MKIKDPLKAQLEYIIAHRKNEANLTSKVNFGLDEDIFPGIPDSNYRNTNFLQDLSQRIRNPSLKSLQKKRDLLEDQSNENFEIHSLPNSDEEREK